MKFIKNTLLVLIFLLFLVIIFRERLYQTFITYKFIGTRTNYTTVNKNLIDLLNQSEIKEPNPKINDIISKSLIITSRHLHFTSGKNEIDPNKLINTKSAHCVGYATFYSTVCNHLLEKHNLKSEWSASPQIGLLFFIGINLHDYFKSPFYKDHDFVIIENKNTGERFGVDPSMNDYLKIKYIKIIN